MTMLMILMLALWIGAVLVVVLGTQLTFRKIKTPPPHLDAPFGLYPISVLKPLKGAENGVAENLESFFHLDYPVFELLFSIADETDPVRPIIEKLISRYPEIDARLIIGSVDAGPNPKVNNLIRSYDSAKYDLVLISDSNIRVEPSYLKRMAAHLDNDVGMITAIVAGRNPGLLGGRLEAVFLNTFYARGMYLAAAFGQPCVLGKSMLFRRSVAKRFGGIRNLARYLAEDYMAGVAMRRLGLRVILMCDPVVQHIGEYSFKSFWDRHVRWGRIRKSQAPIAFLSEVLSTSVVSGALGAVSGAYLLGWNPSLLLLTHFAIWSLCDLLLALRLGDRASAGLVGAWALRELVAVPLWIHTWIGNTVLWRGRRLTLQPGGLLEIRSNS